MSYTCRFRAGATIDFDAFLSYSTVPDYALARKTESFLEGFHSTPVGRTLKLRALKICIDGSDFSLARLQAAGATASVIETLLYEHLARCERLLVFCSRNGAASPYVAKEIAWWLEHRDADSILLVVTEGANPSSQPDVFPEAVRAVGLTSRPWYDFRGFRGREARQWSHVRDAEAERVQLAAHLYGETAGRLYPAWQRARDRRRRVLASIAAVALAGAAAGMSWLGWSFTDGYQVRQIAREATLSSSFATEQFIAALARAGRVDEAKALAVKGGERTMEKLNALGQELLSEGHRDAARSIYQLALQSRNGGRILLPPAGSEILANSILLGAPEESIDRLTTQIRGDVDAPLESAALSLATHGMFDRAVALVHTISADAFEHQRDNALVRLAAMAPDRARGVALLDEARADLKPGGKSAATDDLAFGPLAAAYLRLGQPEKALDVANAIGYDRAQVHLSLAETLVSERNWPMVQRAVTQAGEISDSFLKTLSIRAVLQKGTADDALQYTRYLEPDDAERGRLLLETAASYVDPVAGAPIPSVAVLRNLVSAGAALLTGAGQRRNAESEISIARGWIAVEDWPLARRHLASAAQLAIDAKQWDPLDDIAIQFVRAKAADEDLRWIDRIPVASVRDDTRVRVAIERKYGPDGKPLREWLDANKGGGGAGGPYEEWFEKSVAAGDVATAIEASKGIDNEGRRGAVMLDGVRALVKRGEAANAYALMNAIPLFERPGVGITFNEDRFVAIAEVSPALAKRGAVDQAVASIKQVTAPALRARALGAVSVALMPSSPKRATELLIEAVGVAGDVTDVSVRDRELRTMAEAFCDQGDVASARLVLAKVGSDDVRAAVQVQIVRALLKRKQLRRARIESDGIANPGSRAQAYLSVLEAYAAARYPKDAAPAGASKS